MSHLKRSFPYRPGSSCRSHDGHVLRTGFSLIELVIVIAIIAALLALTLPALRGVHLRSKKTRELSNLRQVGVAWFLYAQDNNDSALPGFLDSQVQTVWDVSYKYPNIIAGRNLVDEKIPQDVAAPWPWRLFAYMNNEPMILQQHLDESDMVTQDLYENADSFALQPAFGYNGYYIGGFWQMTSGSSPRPSFRFASAHNTKGKLVNVVARSPSTIRFSDKMLVFCSTTERDPGLYHPGPSDVPGFHLAVPPVLAEEARWQMPGQGNIRPGSELQPGVGDVYSVEVLRQSAVPLGRYTGAAAVFYADGHTAVQTPGALSDQSIWIPGAEQVDEVPARKFTHTDS